MTKQTLPNDMSEHEHHVHETEYDFFVHRQCRTCGSNTIEIIIPDEVDPSTITLLQFFSKSMLIHTKDRLHEVKIDPDEPYVKIWPNIDEIERMNPEEQARVTRLMRSGQPYYPRPAEIELMDPEEQKRVRGTIERGEPYRPIVSPELKEVTEAEGQWWFAVKEALRRHTDHDGKMICPICGEEMTALRRPRRMTFAGWEEACIQVNCERCGEGGEIQEKVN